MESCDEYSFVFNYIQQCNIFDHLEIDFSNFITLKLRLYA